MFLLAAQGGVTWVKLLCAGGETLGEIGLGDRYWSFYVSEDRCVQNNVRDQPLCSVLVPSGNAGMKNLSVFCL